MTGPAGSASPSSFSPSSSWPSPGASSGARPHVGAQELLVIPGRAASGHRVLRLCLRHREPKSIGSCGSCHVMKLYPGRPSGPPRAPPWPPPTTRTVTSRKPTATRAHGLRDVRHGGSQDGGHVTRNLTGAYTLPSRSRARIRTAAAWPATASPSAHASRRGTEKEDLAKLFSGETACVGLSRPRPSVGDSRGVTVTGPRGARCTAGDGPRGAGGLPAVAHCSSAPDPHAGAVHVPGPTTAAAGRRSLAVQVFKDLRQESSSSDERLTSATSTGHGAARTTSVWLRPAPVALAVVSVGRHHVKVGLLPLSRPGTIRSAAVGPNSTWAVTVSASNWATGTPAGRFRGRDSYRRRHVASCPRPPSLRREGPRRLTRRARAMGWQAEGAAREAGERNRWARGSSGTGRATPCSGSLTHRTGASGPPDDRLGDARKLAGQTFAAVGRHHHRSGVAVEV